MSPNTPAGSTWLRSRSACCAASASTGASPSASGSSPKSPPGSASAMQQAPASIGCSPPNAPAPNSPVLTPTPPKSHNPCAKLLDAQRALDGSALLRQTLGDSFVDSYVKLRMAEWNDYMRHLTEWERERTLDV